MLFLLHYYLCYSLKLGPTLKSSLKVITLLLEVGGNFEYYFVEIIDFLLFATLSLQVKCVEVFKEFYHPKAKNRKLTWIYSLGTCNIFGNFNAKSVELIVTTYQVNSFSLFFLNIVFMFSIVLLVSLHLFSLPIFCHPLDMLLITIMVVLAY